MSEAILQASGIVKRYGKFTALAEVDLRILPRTVHSVIGPNGAGKTTLFHVLTGTLPITAGKIVFDGHDVTHEPDHKRASRGVARSFQVTSLFANLSVRENLRLAAQGVDARRALNAWTPPRGTLEHADVVDSVLEHCSALRAPLRAPCRTVSSGGWRLAWHSPRDPRPSFSTNLPLAWASTISTT
jgi:branched-chain amino acid transport system ATP-binding protein